MSTIPYSTDAFQAKLDFLTKPVGALGQLETMAAQIAAIQQTMQPKLAKLALVVYAGDHGIADQGVSAYPKAVTQAMVYNFLRGGAAINMFAELHGIDLYIADAGVDADFPPLAGLWAQKVAHGTADFSSKDAMTWDQCQACLDWGRTNANTLAQKGYQALALGEMGIGNTTAATALLAAISGLPVADLVGLGTGISPEQKHHKAKLITQALNRYAGQDLGPQQWLAAVGGLEIAQMVGAMLGAYSKGMVLLVDGFIATSAYVIAAAIEPKLADNAIFCHASAEQGHQKIMDWLGKKPLLDLGLRLGEGTGAALAWPLVKASLAMLNMATFADLEKLGS